MKKLALVLSLIVCLFSFTACSQTEEKEIKNADELATQSSEIVMNLLSRMDQDTIEKLKGEGAEYLEYAFDNQLGIKIDGNGFVSALDSWGKATEEIGRFVSVDSSKVTTNSAGDQIIVTLNCTFEKRTAQVEFIYKTDLFNTLKSCATNVEYSFAEKMQKAGLNTLMGMGTVFAVLILIYGIISLFSFIPVIEKAFAKDKTAPATNVDKVIEKIVEKEEMVESDDSELVAVIAAAIAASEGTSTDGFTVRSIRRVKTSKWARS